MKKRNTISIKMTMRSEMHSLIMLLEHGNSRGKKDARDRLFDIANSIDTYNMSIAINKLEDFLTATIPILKASPDIDTCFPVDYESALVKLTTDCDYNWEHETFSEGIESLDTVQIYEHFLDVVEVLKLRHSIPGNIMDKTSKE